MPRPRCGRSTPAALSRVSAPPRPQPARRDARLAGASAQMRARSTFRDGFRKGRGPGVLRRAIRSRHASASVDSRRRPIRYRSYGEPNPLAVSKLRQRRSTSPRICGEFVEVQRHRVRDDPGHRILGHMVGNRPVGREYEPRGELRFAAMVAEHEYRKWSVIRHVLGVLDAIAAVDAPSRSSVRTDDPVSPRRDPSRDPRPADTGRDRRRS
jgi:hypothetical protein